MSMLLRYCLLVFLCLLVLPDRSLAQDKNKVFISEDAKPTLDLNPEEEEEEEEEKKKKRKKKVFYGYKTRKSFTPPVTRGRKTLIETFYTLKKFKDYESLDPYVKEIYYLDVQRKKIKTVRANKLEQNEKEAQILHGPYTRYINKNVVETGVFYLGTKHGRWELYNLDSALVDKQYWYKGWPKDSEIEYYDLDRTQVKEVVCIEWEEKKGDYVYFNENGSLRITGKYDNGIKVGKWRLYYVNPRARHMEIQYAENKFDYEHKPIVLREWDRSGELIYDYRKSKETRFFDEEYLKELQAKK